MERVFVRRRVPGLEEYANQYELDIWDDLEGRFAYPAAMFNFFTLIASDEPAPDPFTIRIAQFSV